MKEFTYHFADGTSSTVEVEDELFATLIAEDKEEKRLNYNYKRHNTPISAFEYQGDEFADPRGDAFDVIIRNKNSIKIQAAIDRLTEGQQELIRMVYCEDRKVVDIAEELGVGHQAISNRLNRIRNKLKNFFGEDRDILPFSSLYSEGVD